MTVIKLVPSRHPARIDGRWRWLRAVLCIGAICALAGCVSTQQRGDRAFKAGQFSEALDHYERAIDGGDHSAQIYSNAAQAALRIGDFSLAERYFNRALQNGGGESVARELADFYIATSNYTKAVRVLQTVLETTQDPQTVFNDLGAALMYAGSPLNAESYLMVAQQMKPSDPVPYVNLGVLYDKHLNNPRLAYGFYHCFLKLSPNSRQSGKVRARVKSLESSFDGDGLGPAEVSCSAPYQPVITEPGAMKGELARRLGQGAEPAEVKPSGDEAHLPEPTAEQSGEESGEITIDRGVVEPPVTAPSAQQNPAEAGKLRDEQVVALAESAFANHNHQEVVNLLKGLPADALTTPLMGLYGQSLAQVKEYDRARRWLSATIAEKPAPAEVHALWTVYRALGEPQAAVALCERFEGAKGYGDFLKACASAADLSQAKTSGNPVE